MSVRFEISAEKRQDVGKGASRRLRRSGSVPGVIYGANKEPQSVTLPHDVLVHQLENETFYSSILDVNIDGMRERAIIRDLQRHPYKPTIMHIDFQRVSEDVAIRVHVPLHFVNEDTCRGVKDEGGAISHMLIEVEISCLPKFLPEHIEVDVANLGLGESIHLSELVLPEGIEIVQLSHGEGGDTGVVNVHHVRVAEEEPEEGADDDAADGGGEPAADGDSAGDSEV